MARELAGSAHELRTKGLAPACSGGLHQTEGGPKAEPMQRHGGGCGKDCGDYKRGELKQIHGVPPELRGSPWQDWCQGQLIGTIELRKRRSRPGCGTGYTPCAGGRGF